MMTTIAVRRSSVKFFEAPILMLRSQKSANVQLRGHGT
jgi:hypothetical protein